jgi:hypothetical protein
MLVGGNRFGNQVREVRCCIEGSRVASAFDAVQSGAWDCAGECLNEVEHAFWAALAVAADDGNLVRRRSSAAG